MANLEEILKNAGETRALRIGNGIIDEVSVLFSEQFPGKKAIIVADTNTYRVAGNNVYHIFKKAGIEQEDPFIYSDPDLFAEYSYLERLIPILKTTDAIPVAVGSGTINDLTKLASYLAGRRYMCVATAASMDGYTAFGASITSDGAKKTFSCPAPLACLADIEIIRSAPKELTASGYADLFAKITAGADWILADAMGIEPINSQAWSIIQDGLHESLSDPMGIASGTFEAISRLTEGLMLGGFAMQCSQSSRPASGAEHQFSHLWNMEHFLNNGERISHGFQVSLGTLAITALYEQVINTPFNKLDVKACCRLWPSQEDSDTLSLKMFAGTDFPLIGLQETRAKYISSSELSEQLGYLKGHWTDIRKRLVKQLIPYAEARKRLQLVGAPTDPEDIGMTRSHLRETFVRAQFIRRRYTVLDLAVRTRYLNTWLDNIFMTGSSMWEIRQ
jgi:glycerol-1-phosphate dehydrogenase [NAD(P)+]